MSVTSFSMLPIKPSSIKMTTYKPQTKIPNIPSYSVPISCQLDSSKPKNVPLSFAESKKIKECVSSTLAAVAVVSMSISLPAMADLNKFEAEQRGEFGIGSAAQFGSADLKKAVHVNENFRRANFTSADMRGSDFSGSTFNGAYLEKAVAYKANFTGADFSDTLMDRMVLNEANLTNAVLVRSVVTRSDLAGAKIEGADFSDAVLDLSQKQVHSFQKLKLPKNVGRTMQEQDQKEKKNNSQCAVQICEWNKSNNRSEYKSKPWGWKQEKKCVW